MHKTNFYILKKVSFLICSVITSEYLQYNFIIKLNGVCFLKKKCKEQAENMSLGFEPQYQSETKKKGYICSLWVCVCVDVCVHTCAHSCAGHASICMHANACLSIWVLLKSK